jgi:CRP-like cAMP-binding protein/Fe-S-cluster-containing hydrogenase component 2/thioredoxin reductase
MSVVVVRRHGFAIRTATGVWSWPLVRVLAGLKVARRAANSVDGGVVADRFHIVIVGSGPAGLSAAARAAELDREAKRQEPSYVLLESFDLPAKTIQRYQKGKPVMDEPGFLDLRSDLLFAAGARERVLSVWTEGIARLKINIRFGTEVTKIAGQKGEFLITLGNGSQLIAENVVLAIGIEGNPNKLGVPGEELPGVQYQLDDPKEYRDERVLVVGASDSAIENALALAEQNSVWIINRGKEFQRAKDANRDLVVAAINDPLRPLSCFYETRIKRIDATSAPGARPLTVTLETPAGPEVLQANRIVARLGANPPRKFVESIGIQFPGEQKDAIPALSKFYESNVPGVYIVGSLAGYPLIKQAMNQGYDVVELIHGNKIRPVDDRLLQLQFQGLPDIRDPEEYLERFRSIVPMFRELNALAFRELILESEVIVTYPDGPEHKDAHSRMQRLRAAEEGRAHKEGRKAPRTTRIVREGDVLYSPGEFGTSFFTIVSGEVRVSAQADGGRTMVTTLSGGEFFGEMSLLSGRPRAESVTAGPGCVLVETPRRTMLKLMSSNEGLRRGIDWIFIVRELQRHFAPYATFRDLRNIAQKIKVNRYPAGTELFKEGDRAASLFVLRSGNVRLTRRRDKETVLVGQVPAGRLLGEIALMGDPQRRETATATVASEALEIGGGEFRALVGRGDARVGPLQKDASQWARDSARLAVRPESGSLLNFMMAKGLGEATNVLVIDQGLCVGCDNCEKACAETHAGISRLDREAGPSFARIQIPVSCRHCQQPHCMKDCPPNALRRAATGEVYIDDSCIGCGNCQSNCPYGAIRMAYAAPKKPGLWAWLLAGAGPGPGEEPDYQPSKAAKERGKKAVKCDACLGVRSGPACVSACPTGAAIRIGPDRYVELIEERH